MGGWGDRVVSLQVRDSSRKRGAEKEKVTVQGSCGLRQTANRVVRT